MSKLLGFFAILTMITVKQIKAAQIVDCAVTCLLPNHLWKSTVIKGDGIFEADTIIKSPLIITNYATVTGVFRTQFPVNFAVRNYGVMTANFDLSFGTTLSHYISSVSEMQRLNVTGHGVYLPIIRGDFNGIINAADLLSLYSDLRVLVEKNGLTINARMSDLDALAAMLDLTHTDAKLLLVITDYDERTFSLPEFNGLVIYSVPDTSDAMFMYWTDGHVVRKARQTDYRAIFGNWDNRAEFLNLVRERNPNDRVLKNLDRVQSYSALVSEMKKTMFFNPLVLNASLKRYLSRAEFNDYADTGLFFGAKPEMYAGVTSNRIYFGYGGDNFTVSAGAYMGSTSEDDDYKYGHAGFVGLEISAYYETFGFGIKALAADWTDITIQSANSLKDEATSRLFHIFSEFSPEFRYVRPMVRLNYVKSQIEEFDDKEIFVTGGARLSISDNTFGIKNKYSAYIIRDKDEFDYGITFDSHFVEDNSTLSVKLSPKNLSIEFRMGF